MRPETFPIGSVIAGWAEAPQLMQEGAKWRICVPSQFACGKTGMGHDIGPNSVLIFEIEPVVRRRGGFAGCRDHNTHTCEHTRATRTTPLAQRGRGIDAVARCPRLLGVRIGS
ncbi:MAG: FKBP-type peptidyl-prolyl cis-trans isomerase [Syntrophobacteraceae bacterium]|nr:FKBP-type peptidyl-prolyl cis-trans isomerase [Desulfobacteraceae bacterium]